MCFLPGDLKSSKLGYSRGLKFPFFLVPMRLNRAVADLQPASCCNSEAMLRINTAALFTTDLIRSWSCDTYFSLSFITLVHPFFSLFALFDEWLCFLGGTHDVFVINCVCTFPFTPCHSLFFLPIRQFLFLPPCVTWKYSIFTWVCTISIFQ